MADTSEEAPLAIPDRDTARRMWDVLEEARFTAAEPLRLAGLDEGESGSGPRQPRLIAVGLRRTAGGGTLHTLTRLFLLGASVPAAQACEALRPVDLDVWIDTGLLEHTGEGVRAAVQLAPVQGRLFASDLHLGGPVRPRHVMGYCGSTATAARLLPRRAGASVLDLGTGCGSIAILAAGWAAHAAGTDLNPRAVNMAAFNARLNGLDNVEILQGDLFAPVQGRRFDRIVCNPPFVLSPESGFLYRDGGRPGDDLLRDLITGSPLALDEGGFCVLVCQWAHVRGQDWRGRLAGWARGTGCDLWALKGETAPAAAHAEKWAGGEEPEPPEGLAARMDRWAEYYERSGIEQVSEGVVVLRRRAAGPNWVAIDDAPKVGGDVGRSIEQGFALRDWLVAHSDDALLRARLRVSPEARLDHTMAASETGWAAVASTIRVNEGLQFEGGVGGQLAGLLARLRGRQSVEEALAGLEADAGQTLDRPRALQVVRGLVEQGILLPTG